MSQWPNFFMMKSATALPSDSEKALGPAYDWEQVMLLLPISVVVKA